MAAMDAIHRRSGHGAVGLAANGWQQCPKWNMCQENLSRHDLDQGLAVRDPLAEKEKNASKYDVIGVDDSASP